MKTFKDFLIWYNNLDVEPFVEAISKMFEFYREKKLDLFKDGISVPGLVMRYLFQNTDAQFSLFDEENEDLFHTFKNNIVGGPSIIFNRYHEKNVTKIRGGKICKNVVGYDANALYLWAMMQQMPTGQFERPLIKKSVDYYMKEIVADRLFGFVEVDIHVPEHLKDKFSEMSPIFKKATISYADLTEEMKKKQSKSYKSESLMVLFRYLTRRS